MKKLLVTTLAVSAAAVMIAKPAQAEEVSKDQSDVGIRFETDGPIKPGPGPYKDNLALVWSPSKMDFGQQKATANIATYSTTVTGEQFIVVNDDRAGKVTEPEPEEDTKAGETTSAWKVTANLSPLISTDTSATELPAKMTFTLGDAQSYDIGEVDPDTNDYLPNPVEGNLSELAKPNNIIVGDKTKDVVLEAGNTTGSQIIAKSVADDKVGGFATKLLNTKLVVTSGKDAAGKKFKGSVTWSLDNTY